MPLTKKRVILARLESTYATDATPIASAHALEVSDIDIAPLNAETKERSLVKQWLGSDLAALSNHHVQLSFTVTLAGAGSSGNAPPWGVLLRGCGFNENRQTNYVQYLPLSDGFKSLTFYLYQDGTLHKVMGARGSFKASFNANDYPKFTFTFRGIYKTPEAATLPSADYSRFKTPFTLSKNAVSSMTLFGQNVAAAALSIDMGIAAPFISYMNSASVEITEREATGKIEIRDPSVASFNFFEKIEGSDTGSLTLQLGTAAGKTINWSAPKVQLLQPSYGNRDGVQTLNFDMRLLPQVGNDEFAILTR